MSNQEKEPMFSAKIRKIFTTPLGKENPITVQVLGIFLRTVETGSIVIIEEGQQTHWIGVDNIL